VWADAAKRLSKFPEAVLTALDAHGYPLSVRVNTHDYDAATGELRVVLPEQLSAVEGPANLLCHCHDEKMWHLDNASVKGRLQRRDDNWAFVSEVFTPRPRLQMVKFLRGIHIAGQKYLDKRGLARPAVNWDAVRDVQLRAAK